MTCDERRDLILLYAAGSLDPVERGAICEHLSTGCPICVETLVEAQRVAAELGASIAPVAPPATAFARLLERLDATPATVSPATMRITPPDADASVQRPQQRPTPSVVPHRFPRTLVAIALTAAACIAITAASLLYWTRDARTFFHSNDLLAIQLVSGTQKAAHAQLLWDRRQGKGRIVIDRAEAPKAGREYEVWIIPPGGAPARSETFRVNPAGSAAIVIPIPSSTATASTFAITDEPLGGTDAPTGTVHFAGTAAK